MEPYNLFIVSRGKETNIYKCEKNSMLKRLPDEDSEVILFIVNTIVEEYRKHNEGMDFVLISTINGMEFVLNKCIVLPQSDLPIKYRVYDYQLYVSDEPREQCKLPNIIAYKRSTIPYESCIEEEGDI